MDTPSGPYREPMPQAPVPRNKWPFWALGLNAFLVLMLVVSFGTCVEIGNSDKHMDGSVGFALGAASFVVGLVATVLACVGCYRSLRAALWVRVLVTILDAFFGLLTTLLVPIFWTGASSGPISWFGGWGRPLRVGRRAVTPGVRASREWAHGPRPDCSSLDRETRELLRDLWLHDARKEHASVPAFGQVAWQLVALGAPSDLVRRAHRCAIQEIDHAERCFALASAYAGYDLGVQAMPALARGGSALPRDEGRALVRVATEALVDGAILEDYNAELAATALEDARDAAVREALVHVVSDEREHAALAWDIVAFCVERGGAPVRSALEEAFARVGTDPGSLYAPDLVARIGALGDRSVLYAHGRVRFERATPVFRARLAAARSRLETVLAQAA